MFTAETPQQRWRPRGFFLKPLAATLTACVCLFLLAFATAASGKQAEAGNPEPKVEAAPEQMVPRSWWLAERRKRKRLARYSVRMEKQRNQARRVLRYMVTRPDPYGRSSDERGFLCIHGFEGAWNDPSAPYWGGLQFDYQFQRTYGPEFLAHYGTADHWPIAVQIAVAIRAKISRGWHPWPNTARYCGLL
jgi:hypothetical protein